MKYAIMLLFVATASLFVACGNDEVDLTEENLAGKWEDLQYLGRYQGKPVGYSNQQSTYRLNLCSYGTFEAVFFYNRLVDYIYYDDRTYDRLMRDTVSLTNGIFIGAADTALGTYQLQGNQLVLNGNWVDKFGNSLHDSLTWLGQDIGSFSDTLTIDKLSSDKMTISKAAVGNKVYVPQPITLSKVGEAACGALTR